MVVDLIAKDKEEKFQFQGRCKLIIDSLSKLLLVEPFNEEFKMISAMFKWKFVAQKNILFVFAEYDFQDFVLIFDDTQKCNKVYGCLLKKKAISGNKELIKERFLLPVLNVISANSETSLRVKDILLQWMEQHDEKEEFIQLLKHRNIYVLFYPSDAVRIQNNSRKRRTTDGTHSKQIGTRSNAKVKKFRGPKANIDNKIIEKPNFEILAYEYRNVLYKRLIIFLDSSRTFCYEYRKDSKSYRCCGCANNNHFNTEAYICQKEDKTECVRINLTKHCCDPRKFDPEKYGEKEIVEESNFKIFKSYPDGIDKSKLVIFASSDKTTCYEYYVCNTSKKFFCCGCFRKNKHVSAESFQNLDRKKYIKLSRRQHICKPREYNPEKFEMSKENASGFKIFEYLHNGTKISRLVVFCETNKNLCYEYFLKPFSKIYQCCYCPLKTLVTATIVKNADSKDSVIFCKTPHVCNLLEFDPEKYKDDVIVLKSMYKITSTVLGQTKTMMLNIYTSEEKRFYYKYIFNRFKKCYYCSKCFSTSKVYITTTIQNEGEDNEFLYVSNQKHVCEPFKYFSSVNGNVVMAPNYQLLKRKSNGKIVQRMVVFTNDDKTECYEYTWNEDKIFLCLACRHYHKVNVNARIFKNDANEECVELSENLHKCKPIKFVPESLRPKIVKLPDFKLYDSVYAGKKIDKLVVFDSKNRNFGYIYTYHKSTKTYVCGKCRIKKKHVIAKVLQDENGENYVELNENEHACELQKI